MGTHIRPAAVAGRFYPAAARELRSVVDECLRTAAEASAPAHVSWPKVLLVPHAGYVYSGPIAGSAYARLAAADGQIRRVVLLGPTHRVAVRGLALPAADAFATPLGLVPVDRTAVAALEGLPQVVVSDAAHAEEHALEVQLPFLQAVLGDFALVPLAVGRATPEEVAAVIEHLWGDDETLIVISSDLSHYLPYAAAVERDRATIDRVLALDPQLDHDEACGATPLAGALIAARRHGLVPELLDLRNSGDTAGDRRHVVGYAAVAFRPRPASARQASDDEAGEDAGDEGAPARAGRPTAAARPRSSPPLGAALLAHAREAIALELGLAVEAAVPPPAHPELHAPGATFVTLHCDGALRGCIGTLRAERPLRDDVRRHAVAAAFEDPRFPPVTAAEFARLDIEVSVLDAPVPLVVASEVEAHGALRPFEDGVVLEWRGRRATFLPQVWEQLPNAASFLAALKRKAGLPPDFWAADLTLSRYGVRKFTAGDVMTNAEETV